MWFWLIKSVVYILFQSNSYSTVHQKNQWFNGTTTTVVKLWYRPGCGWMRDWTCTTIFSVLILMASNCWLRVSYSVSNVVTPSALPIFSIVYCVEKNQLRNYTCPWVARSCLFGTSEIGGSELPEFSKLLVEWLIERLSSSLRLLIPAIVARFSHLSFDSSSNSSPSRPCPYVTRRACVSTWVQNFSIFV